MGSDITSKIELKIRNYVLSSFQTDRQLADCAVLSVINEIDNRSFEQNPGPQMHTARLCKRNKRAFTHGFKIKQYVTYKEKRILSSAFLVISLEKNKSVECTPKDIFHRSDVVPSQRIFHFLL